MPYTEDGYVEDLVWVPGVDFDPYDHDEMEVMKVVWENERHDRMKQLERENESLRAAITSLHGDHY